MLGDSIHTTKTDRIALAAIGAFAVIALLLVSWDSYLYDLWQHHDVIWFYMCGKAWANGMTPYVDFADSKGPLLWLIYGLGYRLSPHNYIGIYWLSCLLYTGIFYYCYKCARLYVRELRLALMAVLFSAVFFLSALTHIEVRAEDFCYLLMLPVFYRFLQHNVEHKSSRKFARNTAIALGAGLGLTLLIKYSCTLALAIFIPYCCIVLPRRCGYSVWRALGWCVLTGIAVMLPLLAWLAWHDCLDDFIHEYFLITMSTFDNLHGDKITPYTVLCMFLGKRVILFTLGILACVIIYCKTVRKGSALAIISLLWFMAVILLNGTDRIYLNLLSLFTVLSAGIITQIFSRWLRYWAADAAITLATLAILFAATDLKSIFADENLERKVWYYYPMLLSRIDQPRLLYLMCHDHGESVPVNGLPASKYWSLQMGYTPEMLDNQVTTVKQHKCDAVFVVNTNAPMVSLLDSCGYHRYDFADAYPEFDHQWEHFVMYSDHDLRPTQPAYPTPWQVLFKRNIFSNSHNIINHKN